jgi:acyl carrier protein
MLTLLGGDQPTTIEVIAESEVIVEPVAPAPQAFALIQEPVVEPIKEPLTSVDVLGLSEKLVQIVSDKTGYPVEMLELDMDMEADLGIDSIKRVEILGALQEMFPEMARPNPESIGEVRTLAQIAEFMGRQLRERVLEKKA